jgi:hypothetical protein
MEHYFRLPTSVSKTFLVDLYEAYKQHMEVLDLEKRFKVAQYNHNEKNNPLWYTFDDTECETITKFLHDLGLMSLDPKITLSSLPIGYNLPRHRDFGRKTVLIFPIHGYDKPIIIDGKEIYYNDQPMLMDASIEHEVLTHDVERVGLQVSFRQAFEKVMAVLNTNKGESNG